MPPDNQISQELGTLKVVSLGAEYPFGIGGRLLLEIRIVRIHKEIKSTDHRTDAKVVEMLTTRKERQRNPGIVG